MLWYDACMSPEQIAAVVKIITKARTDQQVKLRFGARKRTQLAKDIKDGTINTSDYRYLWVKEARNAIIDSLGASAEAFNAKYPHDSISVNDFIDVLNSVLLQIQAATKDS